MNWERERETHFQTTLITLCYIFKRHLWHFHRRQTKDVEFKCTLLPNWMEGTGCIQNIMQPVKSQIFKKIWNSTAFHKESASNFIAQPLNIRIIIICQLPLTLYSWLLNHKEQQRKTTYRKALAFHVEQRSYCCHYLRLQSLILKPYLS